MLHDHLASRQGKIGEFVRAEELVFTARRMQCNAFGEKTRSASGFNMYVGVSWAVSQTDGA